jgi:hypothetical protein
MKRKSILSIVTNLDYEGTEINLYVMVGNEVVVLGNDLESANKLSCSPELLDTLFMAFADMSNKLNAINADLKELGDKLLD